MRRDSRDKSLRPVARHLATVAGNITPPHQFCLKTLNILGIYARPVVNLIPNGNLIRFEKTLIVYSFLYSMQTHTIDVILKFAGPLLNRRAGRELG